MNDHDVGTFRDGRGADLVVVRLFPLVPSPFLEGDDPEGGPLTPTPIDKLILRYVRERVERGEIGRSTSLDYRSRLATLSAAHGRRPMSQFGEATIDRWLRSVAHMRPAARRAYLSTVRVFCAWLVRRGHIVSDPTVEAARVREPRRVPRALSAHQVATLLASRPDLRSRVVLQLMVQIGLRCVEVARLRVEHYDSVERTVFIVGKGSHERLLPVPHELACVLDRYLIEEGNTSGPLLRSYLNPSRGLSAATVSKLVSDWMRDAGLKLRTHDGVSAHALRHTCLSDVADESGGDMRVVQELGGHANLATASIYQRRLALAKIRIAVEGRSYRRAVA